MWSGHAFASIISIPFCWHNLLSISPMSALISRYITCLRYFGANTMWYSHLHFVSSKLFMSFSVMEKNSSIFLVWLADLNFNLSGSSFFVLTRSLFLHWLCLWLSFTTQKAAHNRFLPAAVDSLSMISLIDFSRRVAVHTGLFLCHHRAQNFLFKEILSARPFFLLQRFSVSG